MNVINQISEYATNVLNETSTDLSSEIGKNKLLTFTSYNIQNSTAEQYDLSHLIDIEKVNDTINWFFNRSPDLISKSMSEYSGSCQINNVFKTKHEIVCQELFNLKSDTRLDEVFESIDDGCDHLTPDFIMNFNDFFIVIEVGTVSGMPEFMLKNSYDSKLLKYTFALSNRSKTTRKPVIYFPLIISGKAICCPVTFNQNTVNDMVFLFRIGRHVELTAKSKLNLDDKFNNPTDDEIVKEFINVLKNQDEITDLDKTGYNFDLSTYNYYKNYRYNSEVIQKNFKTIGLINNKKYSETIEESLLNLEKSIIAHRNEILSHNPSKRNKSIVQMPLFVPMPSHGVDPSRETPGVNEFSSKTDPILRLWQFCMVKTQKQPEMFIENPERILEVSSLDDDEKVENHFKDAKTTRRHWHRIRVEDIPEDLQSSLSLQGLWGKKHQGETANILKKISTKKSFHPDTPVDDVEKFLNVKVKYNDVFSKFPILKNMISLINYANELANNSDKGLSIIKTLMDTDLFSSLLAIQAIATECCISIKQNAQNKEFIYKKIRGMEVELLIHPTKSNSHLFFSIRFKTDSLLDNSVFRKVNYHNGWYYTDLLSTNKSKLDNLIKSPNIWLNSIIHWHIRSGEVKDYKTINRDILINVEASYLSKLSLLFALEDKFLTEEMATGLRYISMQLLKGKDKYSSPKPHKAIEKLPTLMRSRLAVYTYNKLINYAKRQMILLPSFDFLAYQRTNVEHEADNWINLINPYTESIIQNSKVLVDLFYIAYDKNKSENPQNNSDYQMIKKILKYVVNEDEKKKNEGIYSAIKPLNLRIGETPKNHEWCIDTVAHSCELAQKLFSMRYGSDWSKEMERYIVLECLKRTNLEALATMKASALFKDIPKQFDHSVLNLLKKCEDEGCDVVIAEDLANASEEPDEREKRKRKKYQSKVLKMPLTAVSHTIQELSDAQLSKSKQPRKSCKCAESVAAEIKSGLHESVYSIMKIDDIINLVKAEYGGICCYLFKKNQHGGLREIYVLTFKSRILQCFVETVSRTLCAEFLEETMTHPESKSDLLSQHQRNVTESAMRIGGKVLSRQSAEDKSKWNQNNNVNMYAFILTKLTSTRISKMCFKILHLWRDKKIMIPEGVLHLIAANIPLSNEPELEILRKEFWEGGGKLIKERGTIFMTTPTGMLQGILHYTSSLQHVLQTIHYKFFLKQVYLPIIKHCGGIFTEITTMVSSDDSMTKISIVVPNDLSNESSEVLDKLLSSMLHSEDAHSSFFNMIESDKTVLATSTMGEYNSVFNLAGSQVLALIKSVYASLSIQETESLLTRQESYYNLLKDILENGSGHFQAHLHQLVQAMFHYSSMGLFPCYLFPEWCSQLYACPDPSLGFHLIDNELITGLMGYNFSMYSSLYKSKVPILISYPKMLKTKEKYNVRNAILSIHGNRQRWLRFANNISKENWREKLNENPCILYLPRVNNLNELELRLSAKASSKGIYESLSDMGNAINIFASSVYSISNPSFTIREYDLTANEEVKYKRSLRLLQEKAIELSKEEHSLKYDNMTENIKQILFPNYRFYDTILSKILELSSSHVSMKVKSYKQRKNTIITRDIILDNPLPLISVLRKKWFNLWIPYGNTLVQASWDKYSDVYNWLNPSCNKSLKNSPFNDHIEMYNFISGLSNTRSRCQLLCRPMKSTTPVGQIIESIKYNHFPGIMLDNFKPTDLDYEELDPFRREINMVKSMRHLLSFLIIYPCDSSLKYRILSEIIKKLQCFINPKLMYRLPENMIPTLAFIMLIQENDLDSILKILVNRRLGVIPLFLKEQYFNVVEKKYKGFGKLLLITKDVYCLLSIYDNNIIRMEVDDQEKFRLNWPVLKSKIEELGFNFTKPSLPHKERKRIFSKEINVKAEYLNFFVTSKGDLNRAFPKNETKDSIHIQIFSLGRTIDKILETVNFHNFDLKYEINSDKISILIENVTSKAKIKLYNIYPSRKLGFEKDLIKYWPVNDFADAELQLLKNWIYFEAGDYKTLFNKMRTIFAKKTNLHTDELNLKNWLSTGLTTYLLDKSKLTSRTLELSEFDRESKLLSDQQGAGIIAAIYNTNFAETLSPFISPDLNLSSLKANEEPTDYQIVLESSDESEADDWSEEVEREEEKNKRKSDKESLTDKSLNLNEVDILEKLYDTPLVRFFVGSEKESFKRLKDQSAQQSDLDYEYDDTRNVNPTMVCHHAMDRMSDLSTFSTSEHYGNVRLAEYFMNHDFFKDYVEFYDKSGIWDMINGKIGCPLNLRIDLEMNCWLCNLPFPENIDVPQSLFDESNFPILK